MIEIEETVDDRRDRDHGKSSKRDRKDNDQTEEPPAAREMKAEVKTDAPAEGLNGSTATAQ